MNRNLNEEEILNSVLKEPEIILKASKEQLQNV
jgi:hypothetical protein